MDYTSLCDEVDDILHSNIMYLKVSTGVKISTFMENNKGGWGYGSQNGSLIADVKRYNWQGQEKNRWTTGAQLQQIHETFC